MGATASPAPGNPAGNAQSLAGAAQQFVQSQGTSSAGNGLVWMPGGLLGLSTSRNPNFMPEGAQSRQRPLGPQGSWMSQDDATAAYYNWTDKQRADFRAKAMVGGLLKFGDGDIEAGQLWAKLVAQAGNYGAVGQQVSPTDILGQYVKANSAGGQWIKQGNFEVNAITGEKRYIGPKYTTTTASNINMSDPATVKALTTGMFQQLLGRDPSADEISQFSAALSQAEIQNPSRTTTTAEHDATTGDITNTSSVTTGGLTSEGQQQLAMDQIKKKPEYGVTQAVTTYQNALENAVYGSH